MSTLIRQTFRSWLAEGGDPELEDRLRAYGDQLIASRTIPPEVGIKPLTHPTRRQTVRRLTVRETPPPQV